MTHFERQFMVRSLGESLGCDISMFTSLTDEEITQLYASNAATERLCTLVGSCDVSDISRFVGNAKR